MNITRKADKITRFIDYITLETSLEKMPMTMVASIEIYGVCRKKSAHHFGKFIPFAAFQKKVKMSVHHTPGMNAKEKKIGIFCEIKKKFCVVLPIPECRIVGIGSRDDMIQAKGKIYSFWSGHSMGTIKYSFLSCQDVFEISREIDPKRPPNVHREEILPDDKSKPCAILDLSRII